MATIYNLQPNELFEVPKNDQITTCKMCLELSVPQDKIELGPLYQYGKPIELEDGQADIEVYSAHYFCLLFSPGLRTNGEDEEGIKGFLPDDILKEWRRGQKLRCCYCDKNYATVGCAIKSCKKIYHLSCGIRKGSLQQFCDHFASYCSEHRPAQKIFASKNAKLSESKECGMCFERIKAISRQSEKEKQSILWSPCCNKWFHFHCVQTMAWSAGYFFKCPMCNNKDEFEAEMKLFGVYVPEQDASWEREGDIFEAIYQRHGTCDAENCLCPNGREFDEDYTEWEIILCKYCGSQGVHVKCGDLPLVEDVKFKCQFCQGVVKKMPPRAKHHFRKIKSQKKKNSDIHKFLGIKSFNVSSDCRIVFVDSAPVTASVSVCANYKVPNPVQLRVKVEDKTEEIPPVLRANSPLKQNVEQNNDALSEIDQIPVLKANYLVKQANSPLRNIANLMPNSAKKIKSPHSSTKWPKFPEAPSPKKQKVATKKLCFDNDENVLKCEKLKQKSILSYFGNGPSSTKS